MKTISVNLYALSELSDEAKETAYEKHLENNYQYHWIAEAEGTLEEFKNFLPITVKDYAIDNGRNYIDFEFNDDDYIFELTGQRLATYLWNNYQDTLYKGKYFSLWSKTDTNPYYTKNGHAPKGKLKFRYSKVMLENSCVLTGYCADEDILEPIYRVLEKPEDITFYDLIEECLHGWLTHVSRDIEYQNSMEFFEEEAEANEREYTEDGELH